MTHQRIDDLINARSADNALGCADAFAIAKELGVSPREVGAAADRMNVHLHHCQLGLFGHRPEKKIVKSLEEVDPRLASAIREGLVGNRLPCRTAWDIAEAFQLEKMAVSAACETLKVKIRPCQLGAF